MPSIDSIEFRGLIVNRPLSEVTGPEFHDALRRAGWREAHNAHILKRLRERGPAVGIRTLGDFARAMRKGETRPNPGGGLRRLINGGPAFVVYREDDGSFITLSF